MRMICFGEGDASVVALELRGGKLWRVWGRGGSYAAHF